jgi:hypothetical protein
VIVVVVVEFVKVSVRVPRNTFGLCVNRAAAADASTLLVGHDSEVTR